MVVLLCIDAISALRDKLVGAQKLYRVWHTIQLVFFEVLKFHEWPIFSFFAILVSRMCLQKLIHCNGQFIFFKELNFTNDQHLQNSRNLCTSKKPTIQQQRPLLSIQIRDGVIWANNRQASTHIASYLDFTSLLFCCYSPVHYIHT